MKIWCNVELTDEQWNALVQATGEHTLVRAGRADPQLAQLAECDATFGLPPVKAVAEAPTVRWVHLSRAGFVDYDQPWFRQAMRDRRGAITNSSSVFADPCAQQLLGMMLAFVRQSPDFWQAQRERTWRRDNAALTVLTGQKVLLVGMGAISRRLLELLGPYRVELAGVRRTPRGNEPFPVVTADDMDPWLQWADHVVCSLPGGESTLHFFNAARLARLRPQACLYNIGRGTTVDQAALLEALRNHRLGAAYLDVTEPEPLAPDSPLWTAPRCLITPHIGGTYAAMNDHLIAHFLDNLRRWQSDQRLLDRVM